MSRLFPVLALTTALAPAGAVAQPPAVTHKIEATDAQAVAATISYEIRAGAMVVTRWSVFLPEPPALPSQTGVKVTATPAGRVVAEASPLARRVRLIDLPVAKPAAGAALPLRLDVRATLRARKLVPLADGEKPPAVAPLTAAERKYYLAPSPHIDYNLPAFREWLAAHKLARPPAEPPLAFTARVLEVIRAGFKYEYGGPADKRASLACGRSSADCGGMTFVLVAALRANGVPARALVGRLAQPRKADAKPTDPGYDAPHVRAEVYVGGVGWVPVDPSYANGDTGKPVTAFIGDDPGDLLVLHVDTDLRLPFPDKERTVDMLQTTPYYWLTGRGTFDAKSGPNGWELKTTPLGKK